MNIMCKTCKHFKHFKHSGESSWGQCLHQAVLERDVMRIALEQVDELTQEQQQAIQTYGRVYFREDFGCVLHSLGWIQKLERVAAAYLRFWKRYDRHDDMLSEDDVDAINEKLLHRVMRMVVGRTWYKIM